MSRESVKPRTSGVFIAAATRYGFVTPSTVAGTARGVVLIAGRGASAEALFAPNKELMNAHRKQSTPKQGHLRPPLTPN